MTALTGTKTGHIGSLTSVGAVLAALLVLSGCGSTAYTWSKPGVSIQQAQQEGFECKQISRQPYYVPVGGVIVGGSEPDVHIWKECLEARGYTVTEVSEDSAPSSRPSAPLGSLCGPSTVTIGTRLKYPNGKMVKVKTLYGNSPRCSDPATPILVDVEEVGE